MFHRAAFRLLGKRGFSSSNGHTFTNRQRVQWAIASSTFGGVSLYALLQRPVYNDAPVSKDDLSPIPLAEEADRGLSPIVWGSNMNQLIDLRKGSDICFKTPTYAPNLFSDPVRDLAFSTAHAACVDANGNVYQWGDAFFGEEPVDNNRPRLTLKGKDIISLAVTPKALYALSASGKIYALSASLKEQPVIPQSDKWSWLFFGKGDPQSLHHILDTDVALNSGERFTSISAGSDHLLALTSNGRTFAHPVTRHANTNGQLGLRKITVQDPNNTSKRLPVELGTTLQRDSMITGRVDSSKEAMSSDPVNETQVGFCDRLFEVPSLCGINVQQVAAGGRTSFARTTQGRVLGWGANEFGQLGLGGNIVVSNVSVPTEILLNKFAKRGLASCCVNIAAGGDLTLFTVERDLPTGSAIAVDVLACGNGQWGGLGNGSYSNAQSDPVRVKNISGLFEYDDSVRSLQPLKPYRISVSPGPAAGRANNVSSSRSASGHVIAILDTVAHSGPSPNNDNDPEARYSPGRDVVAWGLNQSYQLGTSRRASANIPATVPTTGDEGRLMCKTSKETVRDFTGRVVNEKMDIEQVAVAGPGLSVVYWRVIR
ncbi:RCC1 BLIP-II [Hysterangium stoloniferum]|nr:RCC1 BLIP-II [Hysterangium stoloniferum]